MIDIGYSGVVHRPQRQEQPIIVVYCRQYVDLCPGLAGAEVQDAPYEFSRVASAVGNGGTGDSQLCCVAAVRNALVHLLYSIMARHTTTLVYERFNSNFRRCGTGIRTSCIATRLVVL